VAVPTPEADAASAAAPITSGESASKKKFLLFLLLFLLVGLVSQQMTSGSDEEAYTANRTAKQGKKAKKATKAKRKAKKRSSPWKITTRPDPSFKCTKARSWSSRHICKDTEIAQADKAMNRQYAAARTRVTGLIGGEDQLKALQKTWKKTVRDRCERESSERAQRNCLLRVHRERTLNLIITDKNNLGSLNDDR